MRVGEGGRRLRRPIAGAMLDLLAARPGLKRLLFGHGTPVTDDAPGALRAVAAQLRG